MLRVFSNFQQKLFSTSGSRELQFTVTRVIKKQKGRGSDAYFEYTVSVGYTCAVLIGTCLGIQNTLAAANFEQNVTSNT